jgi:hypothetical protein
MPSNQISEFVLSTIGLFYFTLETIKYPPGFIAEKIKQNIRFILKIYINGAVGNTGFTRNLRNGRFIISLFRKNFYGSIENLMVFIIICVI